MKRVIRDLLGSKPNVLTTGQRATHTYIIGQPGTGKSRALESWVMQDIFAGHGVAIIDPHGDLFNNLLARIAVVPKVWERVVILNPCNPKWVVSFNPLEAIKGSSEERIAHFLTDIVVKIWKLDTGSTPRMIWLLTNSFLALSDLGLTLLDLPRFLMDTGLRESLLPHLKSESARNYFTYEFPKSSGAIHQWVTPVLNKLGGLIFDPDVRLMIAGGSGLNFRNAIDRKLILLVNLPKGIIGEGASALLGAFIVAHLQKAALSRADTKLREPFFLYLDEFQNYTTNNIIDILSESRKYALSLTLAHQYLDQLSPDMRSAVLNTAGTLVCFRVGYQDAYHLVKEIFPSVGFLAEPEKGYRVERIGNFPLLVFEEAKKPLSWESLAETLTKLPNREFWSRRRGVYSPYRQRTFNMPDPVLTADVRENLGKLLDLSGQRFGRLKKEVQMEINNKRIYKGNQPHRSSPGSEDQETEDFIWGN